MQPTIPSQQHNEYIDIIESLKQKQIELEKDLEEVYSSKKTHVIAMRKIIAQKKKEKESLQNDVQKLSSMLDTKNERIDSLKRANRFLIKKNESLIAEMNAINAYKTPITFRSRSFSDEEDIESPIDIEEEHADIDELKTSHRIDTESDDAKSTTLDLPRDEIEEQFQINDAAWYAEGNQAYDPTDDVASENTESTDTEDYPSDISAMSM